LFEGSFHGKSFNFHVYLLLRALINLLVLWVQFVLKRFDAYFLSEGLKSGKN